MAKANEEDRVSLGGLDPREALRALLKVDPDSAPVTASTDDEPARRDTCPDCTGDGMSKLPDAAPTDRCTTCGGKGWVPAQPLT